LPFGDANALVGEGPVVDDVGVVGGIDGSAGTADGVVEEGDAEAADPAVGEEIGETEASGTVVVVAVDVAVVCGSTNRCGGVGDEVTEAGSSNTD
jgi:hypothetical protein